MKCPNCNSNVIGNMCRQCGLDLRVYDKATKVSLVLYNRGLEFANRNQLSDAIEALVKSVEFNKRNTVSRNLLGLCYFACGKINEALKEWVISTSYEKKDNAADDYLETFQKNNRLIQKYDDSAHMYNQAISALLQKSEDIAIIHLKKAVEYNPNFVDALNLLCLCSLNFKDRAKASECIERVLRIDVNNKIALSYFRELSPGRSGSNFRAKVDYSTKDNSDSQPGGGTLLSNKMRNIIDEQIMTSLPISQFISFLIGAVCMFAVIYILILPSKIHKYETDAADLNATIEQMENTNEINIKQKDAQIDGLKKELDQQNVQNAKLLNDIDVQARVQKINDANGYLLQGNPEDAVNYIETVETVGLPPETIELYNYIKEVAYPLIEADYYSQATKSYNAKKYEEAKIFYEKSVNYATPNSTTVGDSFYYLGRIAEALGDKEQAKQYYENVINNYKNSNRFNQAKTQLANIQ